MFDELKISVWRGTDTGNYVRYKVPHDANQTVLDVVTYIQRHLDPTLSYRFSCRVGMCGSCAMTVNGVPRWTCRTQVAKVLQRGRLKLAPLSNMTVIKDLAVDMTQFFDKWTRAIGQFSPPTPTPNEFAVVAPQSAERRAVDEAIECIGCGVCYSACDVVTWRSDYLGPAALNRAWSLVMDVRDSSGSKRLAAIAGDAGCHACHSLHSCAELCPKALNPTRSITGLKRLAARAALKGVLRT